MCCPHSTSALPVERLPILVADDDMADAMAFMLSVAGFLDVDRAGDGAACLARALDRDYALILLNHHMPRLMGHEALAKIRRHGRQARVLVVSAHSIEELADLYDPLGVDDYIEKPFSTRLLVGRCRAALARRGSPLP
jgi:two-component system phosphate regulon response regulator PhoB